MCHAETIVSRLNKKNTLKKKINNKAICIEVFKTLIQYKFSVFSIALLLLLDR